VEDNGHYRCYVEKNFSEARLKLIGQINKIIHVYAERGHSMSVRQIYYQLVQANEVPNTVQSYGRIGDIISDGRLAGLISWTAIEDRNRQLMGYRTYNHPNEIIAKAEREYKLDLWQDQEWRPEVWVEKASQEPTVGAIASKLRVDFFSCRGYNSQSEQWKAGRRFARYIAKGQRPIIFHLGDHDPSGLDMTRDNRDRISMFAGVPVMVQRLALNYNQVEELRLPPNPAKMTDSRADKYVEKYGRDSWELDALDPDHIQNLISDAILRVRNEEKFDAMLHQEVQDRKLLREMQEQFGDNEETEENDDDD